MKILIKRPDDDHMEVWLDGKHIYSTDHDAVGWAGLAAVKETVEGLASALGIGCEETWGEDDEDEDEDE